MRINKLLFLLLLIAVGAGSVSAQGVTGSTDLFPPNARPGECYARVFIPPQYNTKTDRIVKSEASERIEIIPAQYEWVEERVMVREQSERIVETIPAQYEMREERVMVKPATWQLEVVPARYETVTERIIKRPGYTTWKKGVNPYSSPTAATTGPAGTRAEATGEIMCLVEVPPEYETITKRVLASASSTRRVEIPAEYSTVRRRVMTKAPEVRKESVPAEYETIRVQKLVSPPQERRVPIPAEYETIEIREKISDGIMNWAPVLCETNATPAKIRQIQQALKDRGFEPGPIDGIIAQQTMSAVRRFQERNGLAVGELTSETLQALGVNL